MIDLKGIKERAEAWIMGSGKYSWQKPEADAYAAKTLVARLVRQVKVLNDGLENPIDICPECCATCWHRPGKPGVHEDWFAEDFTKRRCSDCGEIRPDPDKDEK